MESKFVGRENHLKNFSQALSARRSLIVFGGPKIGKSSLVQQFENMLELRAKRQPKNTMTIPVTFSLTEELKGKECTKMNLANIIWNNLIKTFKKSKYNIVVKELPEFNLKPNQEAFAELEKHLEILFGQLKGQKQWVKYFIVIDDSDPIATMEGEETQQYLNEWITKKNLVDNRKGKSLLGKQSVIKKHYEGLPECIFFIGQRQIGEMVLDRYSPLKSLRVIQLGLLNPNDITDYFKEDLKSKEELGKVFQVSNGHPLILNALKEILKEKNFDDHATEIIKDLEVTVDALFSEYWQQFDMDRGVSYKGAYAAPEHALMQYLIQEEEPVTLKEAESYLSIKGLKEYSDFLMCCGVVRKKVLNDDLAFHADFNLWNRWYNDKIKN